ncbi:MAG TPA: GNAT family N-acetyltransferase [Acidimicrobiales bacterium]|nr:GNAT family N-acetyltransferase [Acidimicrobiales bacterium]
MAGEAEDPAAAPGDRGADEIVVRPRTGADLAACIETARVVHRRDGYPVRLPTDLLGFLASPDAHGAWVAVPAGCGDAVLGHVALHRRGTAPVMALASEALGLAVDRLAVIARLFVAPVARRRGVARTLLDTATGEAHARGLWPVLDVAVGLGDAVRLYESSGWRRAGDLTVSFAAGWSLDEHVYLGPPPAPGAAPRRPGCPAGSAHLVAGYLGADDGSRPCDTSR